MMSAACRRPVFDPVYVREKLDRRELEFLKNNGLEKGLERISEVWRLEASHSQLNLTNQLGVCGVIAVTLLVTLLAAQFAWVSAPALAQLVWWSETVMFGAMMIVTIDAIRLISFATDQGTMLTHFSVLSAYPSRKDNWRRAAAFTVIALLANAVGLTAQALIFALLASGMRLLELVLQRRIKRLAED